MYSYVLHILSAADFSIPSKVEEKWEREIEIFEVEVERNYFQCEREMFEEVEVENAEDFLME